ncbi:OCTL-like protein [Mya arenaria]|uniref:OCTL-like protein n=1 Tax=Mya arenaria TaxID=6604 RepID=A0ABY7E002_MYAAR|nr:organic cation transporter-like protein [Mya arenaria]WAR00506.1 OCTL-like protein [Mya arenaria]
MDVDSIIEGLGGCGRFQKAVGLASHAIKVPIVFTMYMTFFSVAVPTWHCADNDGGYVGVNANGVSKDVDVTVISNWNSSLDYPKTFVNSSWNDSSSYNPFKSCTNHLNQQCSEFVFDDNFQTIVSEWDMVCGLSWVPSTIASVQMAGLFFGNLLSGQLADVLGRKPPLFGSLLLLIVANLLAYFSSTWLVFGVARALCGVAMGAFLTVQYGITSEVTPSNWRACVIAVPSWATGACVFSFVSYLMPYWRKLHLLTALITVPCLAAWWLIPESFRWYLSHNRSQDARGVMKYISRLNRTELTDESLHEMLRVEKGELATGDKRKYSFIHLFKTRRLVKITLLSAINWFALGLLSYGIRFGIQALSGNFFLNLFLFNVIGIPVAFIAIVLTNVIGRRPTVILTYVMATLGCVVVGIVQYIDTPLRAPLTNGFALFASVGIELAWGPVQVMTQELYPTVIRNIGYGFQNTFSRVGAIIGPQLAFLDTRVPGVMYFVCGAVGGCCILGTLALSETRGAQLQDRIDINIVAPAAKMNIKKGKTQH